jgi:DNA-binding NtrC family response regulator
MDKILIVDDDKSIIKSLEMTLQMKGYNTLATTKGNEVLSLVSIDIDAILLDVNLGHYSGRDILQHIVAKFPIIPVIMISGLSTMEDAVESIKDGAFDFIEKPLKPERLFVSLTNALNYSRLKKKSVFSPIFKSKKMENILSISNRVSSTNASILITGESGVGKDVIANYIHSLSKRGTESMVGINCGAIPENLIESELFGFKKGSFTGSISDSEGKIYKANKSTLFLDEVGELPLSSQVKLLRFLGNGEIQRIGESKTIKVDVRLIVATNRDLLKRVEEGLFREDLLYRLNVIHIEVPPLRERRDDIPPLVNKFNHDICKSMGIVPVQIPEDVIRDLKTYDYPGNIRQLKNIIERAIIMCQNGIVSTKDIQINNISENKNSIFDITIPLSRAKHDLEKRYILTQLNKYNGSVKETAKGLEILPNNLSRRMKDLDIKIDSN